MKIAFKAKNVTYSAKDIVIDSQHTSKIIAQNLALKNNNIYLKAKNINIKSENIITISQSGAKIIITPSGTVVLQGTQINLKTKKNNL